MYGKGRYSVWIWDLLAVIMKNTITPCSPAEAHRRFGEVYYLPLQGWVSQAGSEQEACGNAFWTLALDASERSASFHGRFAPGKYLAVHIGSGLAEVVRPSGLHAKEKHILFLPAIKLLFRHSLISSHTATGRGSGVRVAVGAIFSLLHVVQTGFGAHPASYPMGTGAVFFRG
jgi:hypothetical protein